MGVRSVHGALVCGVMVLGLVGCGGGGGGKGNPNEEVSNTTGEPTKTTASGIHEACTLLTGDETQVNLTADAAGAPLLSSSTNYHVIAAGTPAGFAGFFSLSTGGGDVVFSIDTSAVTLDTPKGQATPPLPSFTITTGDGATVTPKESVSAPLECTEVAGAFRYSLSGGTVSVALQPTAWYQFRLVVSAD